MYITKKRYIIFILVALSLIVVVVSSIPFRLYPTHMIVKHVNCFACHAEEFNDLNVGYHIRSMNDTQNRFLFDYVDIYGNESEPYKTLEGACYSCHITYKNYDLFGLTDPYVYNGAVGGLDAQYGYIIPWAAGNRAIEYFGTGNVAITVELDVLSITPSNSAIDSTMKIVFSNYSGQQTSETIYDDSTTLYSGDTQTITVGNMAEDYFRVILILDGVWNNSILDLRLSGTDKGTESFIINANNPPIVYNTPQDISGKSYFRTDGTYKAVRLDYVWSEWKNYIIGNIASLEDIQTNNTDGWITTGTCSTPNAWCHINQKTTFMGINDGSNPDRSFYPHNMQIVTTVQCKLCHLRGSLIKGGDGTGIGPFPSSISDSSPTPTPDSTATPGPTPTPGPTDPTPTTTPPTGWTLIWSDEFDGTSVDRNKWNVFDGIAAGSEKDTYFDPSMVSVSNGQLHLELDRVSKGGKNYIGGGLDNYQGVSNGNFMINGRWEIRARFPRGEGLSAYAALYPSGWPPEVDFAEMIGSKLSEVVFTQHWDSDDKKESYPYNVDPDLTNFHTFAVEWINGQLKWYVDGQLITTQTQHFSDENMGFTAGIWAGSCSGWPGCPSSTTVPQYMDIDYVRIYVPQ